MAAHSFTLKPTEEFIELIKLLKLKDLVQSGGHAKMVIEEGEVQVNGEQEFRKRKKLRDGDQVIFGEHSIEILSGNKESEDA